MSVDHDQAIQACDKTIDTMSQTIDSLRQSGVDADIITVALAKTLCDHFISNPDYDNATVLHILATIFQDVAVARMMRSMVH